MNITRSWTVSALAHKYATAHGVASYWLNKSHRDGKINESADRASEVLEAVSRYLIQPMEAIEEAIRGSIEADGVITSAKEHTVGRDGTGVCRSTVDIYEVHQDTVTVDDVGDGPLPLNGRIAVWIGEYGDREEASYTLVSYDGGKAVYRFELG